MNYNFCPFLLTKAQGSIESVFARDRRIHAAYYWRYSII